MSSASISRPIRAIIKWQLLATAVLAIVAGLWAGRQGALSAALGGAINASAALIYAGLLALGTRRGPRGAGAALVAMLRAEAGKVLAIIAQLWAVFALYRDVVPAAFFAAFVLTVIIFSMAFFVRD